MEYSSLAGSFDYRSDRSILLRKILCTGNFVARPVPHEPHGPWRGPLPGTSDFLCSTAHPVLSGCCTFDGLPPQRGGSFPLSSPYPPLPSACSRHHMEGKRSPPR